MDIFALQTFVCVYQSRSFSRAGEQLLLTQPAVSKRIAALEVNLDTRLFDRIGKQVLPTQAGRELYPRAQKILLELEDCRRTITNLSEKVSGRLSFATSHHIGLHRLPEILRQFIARYPDVELDIRFMDSELACAALIEGKVELALATMPNVPPAELDLRPVWPDSLVPVVSRDHDLASTSSAAITPQQLAAQPAILPGSGTYTRELIDQAFSSLGLSIRVRLSTNYLETILMLVNVGMGWAILPQTMVQEQHENLHPIRVTGINLNRVLGVVLHRQRTLSKGAEAMLAMLDQDSRPHPFHQV